MVFFIFILFCEGVEHTSQWCAIPYPKVRIGEERNVVLEKVEYPNILIDFGMTWDLNYIGNMDQKEQENRPIEIDTILAEPGHLV